MTPLWLAGKGPETPEGNFTGLCGSCGPTALCWPQLELQLRDDLALRLTFFFFFFLNVMTTPWHIEVSGPGIESEPKLQPTLHLWQRQIL